MEDVSKNKDNVLKKLKEKDGVPPDDPLYHTMVDAGLIGTNEGKLKSIKGKAWGQASGNH